MSWVVAPQCSQRPAAPARSASWRTKRQDRIADRLGLAFEARQVERCGVGRDGSDGAGDRRGGLGRHDAEPRLGTGERRLHLGATRDEGKLAERRAHRRAAEHIAEQGR